MPIIKKGDKFNRLTAIKFSYRGKASRQYWLFKCDCGKEKVLWVGNVKNGKTKSCGCLRRENFLTHGMKETKTHNSWSAMKNRCLNPNFKYYKNYGGRGIKICDRWLGKNGFINFYQDMSERPENKTLDRIKNNLGYYKENCRWATRKEQANNTRKNLIK